MRILVTGATGFVGKRLLTQLQQPVVLSRDVERARQACPGATVHRWDPLSGPPPAEAFDGVDAVIHLAGDPVAEGRWNDAKRRRIRESRTIGTSNLVAGICAAARPPRVLVSASAVGFYGGRGDEVLDERAQPGNDFLAEVCVAWEQAARQAESFGVRVVTPRIGIVLGPGGGALAKMLLPFKLGLGGRLGDGRQWMPWIHVDDLVQLFLHVAEHEEVRGPINGVAPNPATNRDFTATLASVLHRPAVFPVPAFGLRLAVGEFADILLASQRVVPRVAEQSGFTFRYPQLKPALAAILGG